METRELGNETIINAYIVMRANGARITILL